MWCFVEGLSPPPAKKKKKTKSETQTGAVVREEKQKRTFLPSSQKDVPWLVFILEVTESQSTTQTTTLGGKMFCESCKTASQTDKTVAQNIVTNYAQNKVFVQCRSSFHVKLVN